MLLNLETIVQKYNLKIEGVIHVGAHFGEEHTTYKKLGVQEIHYFEPVRKTFKELIKNVDGYCYNVALGDMEGKIEINVETLDKYGCSSILEPSSNYAQGIFGGKEWVDIKRLDSFVLANCNFMNVDVQGYELEVFKGATETLKFIDVIVCEVNRIVPEKKLDYIDAPTIEDIQKFLSPFGFEMIEVDWAGISWGDALFIKC